MEDSNGQWKTNSGHGRRQLTKGEMAGVAVVLVHIGLIIFAVSLMASITKVYKKITGNVRNKLNYRQNTDIIDVEYKEANE